MLKVSTVKKVDLELVDHWDALSVAYKYNFPNIWECHSTDRSELQLDDKWAMSQQKISQ